MSRSLRRISATESDYVPLKGYADAYKGQRALECVATSW